MSGSFEGPAIVELLGHRIVAGIAQEIELAGSKLLRLAVALPEGRSWPQYYTAGAIYAITPATTDQLDESWQRHNQEVLAAHNLLPPDERARYQARKDAEAAAYRERYALPASEYYVAGDREEYP